MICLDLNTLKQFAPPKAVRAAEYLDQVCNKNGALETVWEQPLKTFERTLTAPGLKLKLDYTAASLERR